MGRTFIKWGWTTCFILCGHIYLCSYKMKGNCEATVSIEKSQVIELICQMQIPISGWYGLRVWPIQSPNRQPQMGQIDVRNGCAWLLTACLLSPPSVFIKEHTDLYTVVSRRVKDQTALVKIYVLHFILVFGMLNLNKYLELNISNKLHFVVRKKSIHLRCGRCPFNQFWCFSMYGGCSGT